MRKLFILATAMLLFIVSNVNAEDPNCITGGPGSSSCEHDNTVLGIVSYDSGVTCRKGYYACCTTNNGITNGARCIKDKPKEIAP